MCGESFFITSIFIPYIGSPPHVWGKRFALVIDSMNLRITPTCVGKAIPLFAESLHGKDHPHMCGESFTLLCNAFPLQGSPPHVWGKR